MVFDSFFNPESIAVIGASNNPKKLGYEVFKNLQGFDGEVYPINVGENKVMEKKAFDRISEIGKKVELAIILVPAKYTPDIMEDLGVGGVKAAVIITGGFREAGRGGLEREVLDIARKEGIRVIGPNSAGVMNTHNGLNGTFIKGARKGKIAFISQSGALGGAMIYKTVDRNIGLSKFISVGNMGDVNFADLLDYLDGDEDTDAITLYIEGIPEGKGFLRSAKECLKPVIALKGGKSEGGSKATHSHTGSLAGSYKVYQGAFRQTGIISAENFEEMFAMARAFSQPLPKGKNVAILTNTGGGGVLVADKIDELGLELVELEDKTKDKLREILPPIAAVNNPIDTTVSARKGDYEKSVELLMKDENVDLIMVIHVVPTFAGISRIEHAKGVIDSVKGRKGDTPVVTAFLAGQVSEKAGELLEEEKIPNYNSLDEAALAAYGLWKYSRNRLKSCNEVEA